MITVAFVSAMTLAATAEAQTVIGSFQGSSDGNNGAYWQDASHSYAALSSDTPYAAFPQNVVTNYAYSLELTPSASGYTPQIQVVLTAAEIAAFNSNSYLTFTFSVPTATNGVSITSGQYQLVNLYIQEGSGGGYGGYQNLISGSGFTGLTQFEPNVQGDTASTNNNQGGQPNFYFYSGEESEFSEVVTINYSQFLTNNTVLEGDTSNGLVLGFQFNQADVTPMYLNNVEISSGPFGASGGAPALPGYEYVVDNFSANGVGPSNPTNDDYYSSAENYAAGDITNVWWNWFGSAFSNTVWAAGVSPSYAPSGGSLEIQVAWPGTSGEQFQVWDQGPANNYYALNISALTYTNFQCDVMFAPGSATNASGNFGALQFGDRTASYASDYFNNGITVSNAGVWQHVSIPLNALTDTNLLDMQGLLIHIYDGAGQLSGASTLYVDNIEFTGPTAVTEVPQPVMSILPTVPGLRMFVGSSETYLREGVISAVQSESWVGSGVQYPVNYSFQLLSYPTNNIDITELAILPENAFNPTANYQTTIYNNPFLDYQDSNGLYVTIAPYQGNGAVTASVQFKVGLPSPTGNLTNLVALTNSTAIGTWTLTMSSATAGTLTAPGGAQASFTIADPNLSVDFANPTVAVIAEQPSTTAGYGLYEDYGTISITGTASGTQIENFANEASDFNSGTSPGGFWENNYSVDPGNLIIVRNGLDKYWLNWTAPATGYLPMTSTNLAANPDTWISPTFYSQYDDQTAPRGTAVQVGARYWTLLPLDDLPTVDGNYQQNPPVMNDALAPNAYFMLGTNQTTIFPIIY